MIQTKGVIEMENEEKKLRSYWICIIPDELFEDMQDYVNSYYIVRDAKSIDQFFFGKTEPDRYGLVYYEMKIGEHFQSYTKTLSELSSGMSTFKEGWFKANKRFMAFKAEILEKELEAQRKKNEKLKARLEKKQMREWPSKQSEFHYKGEINA